MKIHEVRENLENTIKGKEAMLAGLREDNSAGYYVLSNMLDINIEELKKILVDVKKAEEQYNELAWMVSPERMGQ
jgi:hypothetical protein